MISFSTLGKIGLLLLVSASIIGGFLWLPPVAMFRDPVLTRIVVFHVPCSIVGSVATAVGVWYALRYLWKRDLRDDIKSAVSFALAILLWSLTTVTGSIFAKVEWGAYWSWDIKQTCIVMLLLIYLAYFALRSAIDDERKRAAVSAAYTLFALVAVPFLTLILPNSTPNTLHPKDTVFSGAYWTVLSAFALGLTLIYLWAFRLHVALNEMELRLNLRARAASRTKIISPTVVEVRR
ncbi:MAG: cytochrome c biogenesis protein [Armatimonadota bacterium]|nr:cytochrome c biogenesis protein [Armatimonadota bacterium]